MPELLEEKIADTIIIGGFLSIIIDIKLKQVLWILNFLLSTDHKTLLFTTLMIRWRSKGEALELQYNFFYFKLEVKRNFF